MKSKELKVVVNAYHNLDVDVEKEAMAYEYVKKVLLKYQ